MKKAKINKKDIALKQHTKNTIKQSEKEAYNLGTFLLDNWFLLAIGFLTCFVWFCICYTIATFIMI
jgi:hypothetical protein